MNKEKQISGWALLPFVVFVVVFLGSGLFFGDFYAFPAPVAALCGVISAFMLPKFSFKDKLNSFLKGCGDENILTMCIIYLLAGAFAVVSKSIGSVDAVVNLGMKYLSVNYIPVGVFLMASFLSMSAGTSVGTIVALSPIVFGIAENTGLDVNIIGATLLCGAMFGDNLSFISDTTIAATQSLNCKMRDKFRANARIAFPAAFLASLVFIYLGMENGLAEENFPTKENSFLLLMPYLLVILLSVFGVNVFVVLLVGILFSGLVGFFSDDLSWIDFSKKIYEGFIGMNDIFLLSLFTGGLAGIVEKLGGINFLLDKVKNIISGQKTAYLGMGLLVSLLDIAIANNTIAIILSGKISENITRKYGLSRRFSASVLDIFSCIVQGLLPYGAQVLILIELSGNRVNYLEMLQHTWYIYFLLVLVFGAIMFKGKEQKYA